jgi:hypothetical protein
VLGHNEIYGSIKRYRVFISDGLYADSLAMVGTEMNHLIAEGKLESFTVICAKCFIWKNVVKKKTFLLHDIEVVKSGAKVERKIGEPTQIAADGSVSNPPPANGAGSFQPSLSNAIMIAKELADVVQCVICISVPRSGHIFQCPNGHLTCSKCSQKMDQTLCAVCRAPLPQTRIRSIAAEQMIERLGFIFPCAHGCDFSAAKRELEKHENKCQKRLVLCPDSWCKETIPLYTLLQHLDVEFKREVKNSKDGFFSDCWAVSDEAQEAQNYRCWDATICKYVNTMFFTKLIKADGMFHIWLYIAAGAEEAKKYQVKITVANSASSLSLTGKVFPIDIKQDDVLMGEQAVLSFGKNHLTKIEAEEEWLNIHTSFEKL